MGEKKIKGKDHFDMKSVLKKKGPTPGVIVIKKGEKERQSYRKAETETVYAAREGM